MQRGSPRGSPGGALRGSPRGSPGGAPRGNPRGRPPGNRGANRGNLRGSGQGPAGPPQYFNASTKYIWNQRTQITGMARDQNVVNRYLFMPIPPGQYTQPQLLRMMLQSIDTRRAMIASNPNFPWSGGVYWIAPFYEYETSDRNINEIYGRFREEIEDTYRATDRNQQAAPPAFPPPPANQILPSQGSPRQGNARNPGQGNTYGQTRQIGRNGRYLPY